MPANLDPQIVQKLEAFGARWRRLVLWRGICGGFITFLGAMTLVAFIDLLVIMPDEVRLGLSIAAYVVTLGVVWFVCLRWLWRAPGPRELARLVEKAEPGLREDLLSAVELGEGKSGEQWDSEVFRALLQADVARRVRLLRVESILPRGLISFWLRATGISLAVCAILFLVPGLHYDRLMARALAPMANLERVSRVKIRIVEPRLTDQWQPLGDNLPIVVEISGPEPDKVVLESFAPKGVHEKTTMGLAGLRRYTAAVPLGTEGMEFRVRAGDAITQRIAIRTRPRPHVVRFEKVFQYPEYSRLPERRVNEENGDVSELEGTEVTLKLQVNQAIKEGELLLSQDGKTNHVPLTIAGTNQVQAKFPLLKSGTYHVRLVASETGFENKFSPMYELHPLADLVPRVGIDSPKQDLIVPPEEVITLHGSANDDVGLAKVSQWIQVNDGGLTEVVLMQEPKTNAVVTRKWDLLQLGVSPGDRVMTKLTAVDLKGNRAESAMLHLVISSVGLDAKRLRLLEAKRGLRESLTTLMNSAARLRMGMSSDTANKVKSGDGLQTKQLLLSALGNAQEVEQQSEKTWEQLKETMKLARPGRDCTDLAALGRALSLFRQETLPAAKAESETAVKEAGDGTGDVKLRQAIQTAQRVADQAGTLQSAFTDLLASDEADAITENLSYLGREQERMNRQATADSAKDDRVWERLARREGGAAKEAQVVEEMLKTLRQHVPKGTGDRVGKARDVITSNRVTLEKCLDITPADKSLLTYSQKMQKGVDSATGELRPVGAELAVRAAKARDALAKLGGTSVAKIERLRRDVDEQADAEKKLADIKRRGAAQNLEAKIQDAKTRSDADWKNAIAQLKDRADIEETRRDTDPLFVSDATKTAQALGAMRAAAGGAQQAAKMSEVLKEIERAFRILEGAHSLGEAAGSVKVLAQAERWETHTMDALVSRPRDWDWLGGRLQGTPNELKKFGLPDPTVKHVTDAVKLPVVGEIDREMATRQTKREMTPVPEKADRLHKALADTQGEIEMLVQDARNAIAIAAPKLSEMLAGLAQTTEALEKETRDTATQPKDTTDEARTLLDKQADLNRQVEELKEAIRREANVQDLKDAESRERARDADDAVAMLREPPAKAEEALRDATNAREMPAQKDLLTEAADQQKKLGATLNQLAQHQRNMESGTKTPDSRQALRQAEEELGIKSALDDQYKQAEKLAEMEGKSLQDMLKELERELAHNEVMRAELNSIAKDNLEAAKDMLDRVARTEKGLAQSVTDAKAAHQNENSLAELAQRIGTQAKEMADKDVPDAGKAAAQAKVNSAAEMDRARQALNQAAKRTADADALPSRLTDAAQALEQSQRELKAAAASAEKAAQAATQSAQQEAAQHARETAANAAEQAGQLAQAARKISDAMTGAKGTAPEQAIAQAASYQPNLAKGVETAGTDIERSGRHQSRLGTQQGKELETIGVDTQKVGTETLPATGKVLETRKQMAAAQNNESNPQPKSNAGNPGEGAKQNEAAGKTGGEKNQGGKDGQDSARAKEGTGGKDAAKEAAGGKDSGSKNSNEAAGGKANQQNSESGGKSKEKSGQGGANEQAMAKAGGGGADAGKPDNSNSSSERSNTAGAEAVIGAAQAAVEQQLSRLNSTLSQPVVVPPASQAPSPEMAIIALSNPDQSKWMARTLDEIDAAMHAKPKGDGSEQGSQDGQSGGAAKEAAKAASQAQKNSMMAARAQGKVPGEKKDQESEGDGSGDAEATGLPPGALPQARGMREGEWGKLPPKLAQGLMDAQREGMVGEYRSQVETYFRVVAEKARDKKP